MENLELPVSSRLLILSDSLALPRHTPEIVEYEHTWVELLKGQYPQNKVHQLSIGGATVDKLWAQFFYHKNFRPDICIIQSGIVDCSPRAFTELEQLIINSNRVTSKLGNIIIPKVKGFLRKNRYIQLTNPNKFKTNLEHFKAENMQVLAIGIVSATPEYEKIVPGITENIEKYNNILKKLFNENFIDSSNIKAEHLMSDHHHLNTAGHKLIFDNVSDKLSLLQ